MGPILQAIFGGPIGKAIETVVDRVVVDKNLGAQLKADLERELAKAAAEGALGQLEINKVEAASASVFVAGWRPFIGWVCGTALAYQYVVSPILMYFSMLVGLNLPAPPTLDHNLYELVLGMLGMGAMRTFEKWKGVDAK